MLSVFAAITFAACKKKEDTVSKLITVSYPTIKFTSPQFYSFPVGGGPMPNANTIIATAYDSFYKESIKPVIDASKLSSLVPGLYYATVSAKNSQGFIGYAYVYVAITDINDTVNLAGRYARPGYDTVTVTRMARGLYQTSDVAGYPNVSAYAPYTVPGYFVQGGDAIKLEMQTQPSKLGTFSGSEGFISMSPGDTTIQYMLVGNPNFTNETRLFKKL